MRQDATMLATLFERSMGLDDTWEVAETRFDEVDGGADELHVRVARVRGKAVPCPECGRCRGVHDARKRTWRHLDIWQLGTYARRAVPRADCPEHGVRTVLMPWEVRPNPRLAALLGAQVLAACMEARPSGRSPSRSARMTAGSGTCSGGPSRRPGRGPTTRRSGAWA